ncbi:MAG: exo-alpha-sialidase [Rhodanobacteraceae bacterium]|nr:MAG: exo-alpha-sialidase [Rhodanobacteraceae bacterium]
MGPCALTPAATSVAQPPVATTKGTFLAQGVGYCSITQLAYQSDPSRNGRLLLAFERKGTGGIPLYERDRGSGKWRFVENVTDQAHAGQADWQLRWQPNLTVLTRASGPLPAGTVLLAANATRSNRKGQVVAEDLELYASRDGGRTWHYRGSIVQGGGKPEANDNHGVWEPNIRILKNGLMVAYYSSEQHKAEGYNQLLAQKVSRDGGHTWGPEHIDVAIPGGVERPGMAVVTHMPNGQYVMSYEDIDGPQNGHVYLKFSSNGLDWGNPADRGTPVQTQSGEWPAATPIVKWLPVGGPEGVLVVLAGRAGGGGDPGGRTMYWNNDLGRGHWWEARAPVQKLSGNIHAGWTQALLLQPDGNLLQVTSSSSPKAPADPGDNVILYASAPARFDRYEAEDAARRWAVQIDDPTASGGRKTRVASAPLGQLDFHVHVDAGGAKLLCVRWQDLGFATHPVLRIDGHTVAGENDRDDGDGWQITTFRAPIAAGDHDITIAGGQHAMDVDYLQIDPAAGQTPARGSSG